MSCGSPLEPGAIFCIKCGKRASAGPSLSTLGLSSLWKRRRRAILATLIVGAVLALLVAVPIVVIKSLGPNIEGKVSEFNDADVKNCSDVGTVRDPISGEDQTVWKCSVKYEGSVLYDEICYTVDGTPPGPKVDTVTGGVC